MEAVAKEEVLVGLWSLELSDGGWVECEFRDGGGWLSEGAEVNDRADTLLVTMSSVVLGS